MKGRANTIRVPQPVVKTADGAFLGGSRLTLARAGSRIDATEFETPSIGCQEGKPVAFTDEPKVETGRYAGWDFAVAVLAVALTAFLVITMGIRSKEAAVHALCQDRLMALSQAQQSYLVQHGEYADELYLLRPLLDAKHQRMPLVCPITGHKFEAFVQAERYIILAPYTPYSINTGDASW